MFGDGEKAVILLSGGLDSATVLAMAASRGYDCHCMSFDYGQRCRGEILAARRVAHHLGAVEHLVIPIGLDRIGGSVLVDDRPVPDSDDTRQTHGVPTTYVPARNTVFLAFALGWAEVLSAYTVFYGANSLDYSGYPDCRPNYVAAFNHLAGLALAEGASGGRQVEIKAPLQHMKKVDIVRIGQSLGVPFEHTVSCYAPDAAGLACGRCESCFLRLLGFREAGIKDPIGYAGVPDDAWTDGYEP